MRRPPTNNIAYKFAFTLIEMIVAMSLLGLVIFLLHGLFNQTARTVSRGADVNAIVAHSRVLSDQLHRDSKFMVGPQGTTVKIINTPAFLVILQHKTSVIPVPDPNVWRSPQDTWIPTALRSDQLVFFRHADRTDARLQSLTPGANNRFDSDAKAAYARVWYGHMLKTEEDGSEPADLQLGKGKVKTAVDMVLGRQALLLVGSTFISGWPGNVNAGPPITDNNSIWAQVSFPFSATTRFDTTSIYQTGLSGPGTPPPLYRGMSDVMNIELPDLTGSGGLYELAGMLIPATIPPAIAVEATYVPTPAYKSSAYTWAFAGINQRLQANVNPIAPYDAWRMAQGHSYFVPHVSEFAIEFTADITDDLPTAGLDGLPDMEPDEHPAFIAFTDSKGRSYAAIPAGVKWYTSTSLANYPSGPNGFDSTQPLTFDIPMANFHSYATSYPPYDPAPALPSGAMNASEGAFVFGHTADGNWGADPLQAANGSAKWWPYMIRIRYRLHDKDGSFVNADDITGQRQSGQWFEQIIAVPRPDDAGP